jgi:type IX secretion system PorP/SprF family membrane protein
MKKVVISIVALFYCLCSVFSQFDAQMSQYMFNNSSFNPAAVGEGNLIQVLGQFRQQWIGFPNAGNTLNFSINSPLKIAGKTHGLGIKFTKDESGLFPYQSFALQYAFRKKVGLGEISIGASLGSASIGFKRDSVKKQDFIGEYHKDISSDEAIPKTNVAGSSLDVNLGVFYSTPIYYAGLSYAHLNNPKVLWGDKNEFTLKGNAYLTGGYNYVLPNPKYVLKPSFLLKSDFVSMQFDLGSRLEYDEKYWGGLSYRLQDAVILMGGINIASGLSVGCSYDITTSEISSVSYGSFEVILFYSFEYVFGKSTSKYKSIRIL